MVPGTLSETRDGQAWSMVLDGLPSLEYAVTDAGTGLIKGLELTNQTRTSEDLALPKVTHSLDIFHTQREGHRAWRVVESRLWKLHDQAEKAWKPLERQRSDVPARSVAQETLRRAGLSLKGQTGKAHQLRRDAEAALEAAVEIEAAWERAQATLELFTPDGWLNTRKAEAQRDEAVAKLSDACWKKTVSLLRRPQTYAFLDVLAARLEALPLAEEVKRDAIRFEGLRRRRAYLEQEEAAPARGWLLLANLRYQRDETFAEAVESVRNVLRSVWRASSLVEGINSVVRMHRCLPQGLLDLKRLYWNCRRFRTGRRRNQVRTNCSAWSCLAITGGNSSNSRQTS